MTDANGLKSPDSDRLAEIEDQLSVDQIRFLIARLECSKDKSAAEMIGVSVRAVKEWRSQKGALIDEALRLMLHDGIMVAEHVLKRSIPKAAAIKVAALESEDEKLRQEVATEILDRAGHVGKPTQRSEISGPDGGAVSVEMFGHALRKVYGGDDNDGNDDNGGNSDNDNDA